MTLSRRRFRERRMDALGTAFESMREHIAGSSMNRLDADRRFTHSIVIGNSWPTCECGAPMTPFPGGEDAFGGTWPLWMCVLCFGRYFDSNLARIDKAVARFDPLLAEVGRAA